MGRSADVLSELWPQLIASLESTLSRAALKRWLKNIAPISLDEECLRIGVPSAFARDWLERKAAHHLRDEAARLLDRPVRIQFIVQQLDLGLPAEPEPTPPPAPRGAADQRRGDDFAPTPLIPRYTFDNFVVGKSNQFAQAAALAVAKAPARSYNPLFIYGGVGLGKTHLMHAIGHYVLASRPDLNVAYVTGDTFTYHVVTSIREDRFGAFRSRYRDVDLWLVDDIQFIAAKERTEAEFFQTFNALYETGRQVVITSDRPPKELQVMDARLRSRFEWGLIADIKPPDLETRMAILQRKASLDGAQVPDDVTRYIANMVQSNIRILEGALTKVTAAASFTGQPITLHLAMEQLKDHSVGDYLRPVSISLIQEVVAEHFHIGLSDMTARKRTREVVFPRQLAMYLARELLNASFPEIAKRFGGKDHSTVIHACNKVRERAQADPQLRAVLNELTNVLTPR
ncbi:MAG: chromosomal replication initiator protein DnaA [Armatimonadota bacterium]|nr:MAG: chromosomal replication initiator protein DnaA [Armatimonadota bacterium]